MFDFQRIGLNTSAHRDSERVSMASSIHMAVAICWTILVILLVKSVILVLHQLARLGFDVSTYNKSWFKNCMEQITPLVHTDMFACIFSNQVLDHIEHCQQISLSVAFK